MQPAKEQIIDQILVMDAQDGNAGAMEGLVKRWQKRLWHHVYRLTQNIEASWDITQQSWLEIIKGLRRLDDPACFKAWIYRIATNKAIDWIKKSNITKQISIEEIQEPQQHERRDMGVKELLKKLDVKKQAILSLYYFEQLNVYEISIALNIPKGTVKSRLYSARNKLKELYENEYK
jgi:RNA polymerase sigma-70 factor (ECF subfamily)